ncbi:unnamed protein product [Caenorhabditis bovis]|uniref:protein-disulfide reductase n=1 Tax=Caenorhabditis bovis TaxID=2654633 RepID=A0A8S1FEU2_9PELO|nr:unnamed protein product [Caenorhabditis bovis]
MTSDNYYAPEFCLLSINCSWILESRSVNCNTNDLSICLNSLQLEKLDKTKVDGKTALEGKVIALYFSAHWCPPCRQFTPILKDFYEEVGGELEIIFVSMDRSETDLKSYMRECHGDWYHIPFGSADIKKLSQAYGVSGIPALIIVKENGEVITKNGRDDVTSGSKPKAVVAKWKSA